MKDPLLIDSTETPQNLKSNSIFTFQFQLIYDESSFLKFLYLSCVQRYHNK